MGIMHIGWAIAGAVLLLFSAIAVSAGTLSLLMKRMETRISKRIRENSSRTDSDRSSSYWTEERKAISHFGQRSSREEP